MAIKDISKIILKRGEFANLPGLDSGELGYATDTGQLFMGFPEQNVNYEILTENSIEALDNLHGNLVRNGSDYHEITLASTVWSPVLIYNLPYRVESIDSVVLLVSYRAHDAMGIVRTGEMTVTHDRNYTGEPIIEETGYRRDIETLQFRFREQDGRLHFEYRLPDSNPVTLRIRINRIVIPFFEVADQFNVGRIYGIVNITCVDPDSNDNDNLYYVVDQFGNRVIDEDGNFIVVVGVESSITSSMTITSNISGKTGKSGSLQSTLTVSIAATGNAIDISRTGSMSNMVSISVSGGGEVLAEALRFSNNDPLEFNNGEDLHVLS